MRRCALVLLFLLCTVACQQEPPPLARVGSRTVTVAQAEAYLRHQTGRDPATLRPELAARLLEQYLIEEALLATAPDPVPPNLSEEQRGTLVRQRLAAVCPPAPEPPLAQAQPLPAAGESGAERLLLRQLILPDAAAARSARERLVRQEDFLEVSRALSRAPNAATGGMLGWVEPAQLPPEFAAAVTPLPVGGISQPVASSAGWHVFQVVDRRAGPSEHELHWRQQEATARQAEAELRACLRRFLATVPLQVDCRDVPFPCRNPFADAP